MHPCTPAINNDKNLLLSHSRHLHIIIGMVVLVAALNRGCLVVARMSFHSCQLLETQIRDMPHPHTTPMNEHRKYY